MNAETFKNLTEEEQKIIFLYVIDSLNGNYSIENAFENNEESSIEKILDELSEEKLDEFVKSDISVDFDVYKNQLSDVAKEILHEVEQEMIDSDYFSTEKSLKEIERNSEEIKNKKMDQSEKVNE